MNEWMNEWMNDRCQTCVNAVRKTELWGEGCWWSDDAFRLYIQGACLMANCRWLYSRRPSCWFVRLECCWTMYCIVLQLAAGSEQVAYDASWSLAHWRSAGPGDRFPGQHTTAAVRRLATSRWRQPRWRDDRYCCVSRLSTWRRRRLRCHLK